jgi:hypothetical protein
MVRRCKLPDAVSTSASAQISSHLVLHTNKSFDCAIAFAHKMQSADSGVALHSGSITSKAAQF